MGTVCPSALLRGLVDLDVLDNQGTGVEALGIGVGLSVLEETEQVLSGLDGPASPGDTELLAYSTISSQQLIISSSKNSLEPLVVVHCPTTPRA